MTPNQNANAVLWRIAHTWDGFPLAPQEQVELRLQWSFSGGTKALEILVDAPFYGDPPPQGPPGPVAGLWNYEVVELFIVGEADLEQRPRYTEIELSPHGHHLVLQLVGVRQIVRQKLPLDFSAAIAGRRWTGRAKLAAQALPPKPQRGNAFAIHGVGEGRHHSAMAPVPGPAPDFHRLEAFPALTLPELRG